jgi:hypothetical protein
MLVSRKTDGTGASCSLALLPTWLYRAEGKDNTEGAHEYGLYVYTGCPCYHRCNDLRGGW